MTEQELFQHLKRALLEAVQKKGLDAENIVLSSRGLSPQEAIGSARRRDYPILLGREVMVQADFQGSIGQAFTDAPADFQGSLAEVLALDTERDPGSRGLLVATLNAVLRSVGSIGHTVHCRNDELETCASRYAEYLTERYTRHTRIALVGYQPALVASLSAIFPLRALDLNPDVVGTERSGVRIEDGARDYRSVVLDWADVVLCTGSVLCNASFVNFVNLPKDVVFFGTSGAAAAHIFGLARFCPMSK